MITLMPHNPHWIIDFKKEKDSLLQLGEDNILQIEHIGSTAIGGILAKPVIDILIGVKELTKAPIQAIESLGYRYHAAFESVFPFRRYFQKDNSQGVRTHQIHLVHYPSQWFEKHILFREYISHYSKEAKQYEALKMELANQFDNTVDYAQAKNDFCQDVDKKAFLDFKINRPLVETDRLFGFIPQLACHDAYATMLMNETFRKVYGVSFTFEEALLRLQSDMSHWNQYVFAPLMWFEKKTEIYVGRGGLKSFKRNVDKEVEVELTYQIKPEFWNQGFAKEIGLASLDYAFTTLNLKTLICFTAYNNEPSLRVMRKLGFVFEEDFIHAGVVHKLHRLSK